MTPIATGLNMRNGGLAYAILFHENVLWNVCCADAPNVICSESLTGDASLACGVDGVVLDCSEEQVSIGDARTVVAMMEDEEAVRDWSMPEFPGESVSGDASVSYSKGSVSTRCGSALPFEASGRVSGASGLKGLDRPGDWVPGMSPACYGILIHGNHPSCGSRPRRRQSRGAVSICTTVSA